MQDPLFLSFLMSSPSPTQFIIILIFMYLNCCPFYLSVYIVFSFVLACLDSILKSRDITLLTKVHLVKAMIFSVVTYGCESSTIKKSEH